MFPILRVVKQIFKNQHKRLLSSDSFSSLQLEDLEACALESSMRKLKEKDVFIARDFFTLLFQRYPEYIDLFALYTECTRDLVKDELFMRQHAMENFMGSLWEGLSMCTSMDVAADFGFTVGRRHIRHCVNSQHLENGRKVLMEVIIDKYGQDMDAMAKTGWRKATYLLFDNLKRGVEEG